MNRNDYIKENYKRYTISFSYDNVLDIIEHLKLKKSVKNYLKRLIEQEWMSVLAERTAFKETLMDAPTVAAVHIVRCKDCIHREEYECDNITLGNTKCGVTDDWFCADGERR